MTADFFAQNRRRLRDLLPDGALAIVLAGHQPHRTEDSLYRFTPNRNYYYLSGLTEPFGVLLLGKSAGQTVEIAFIERPTPQKTLYRGPMPTSDVCARDAGLDRVLYLDELDDCLDGLMRWQTWDCLYADISPYAALRGPADALLDRLTGRWRHLHIHNLRPLVCNLRRVKTAEEIACLETAGLETARAMDGLIAAIRPGAKTYALRAEYEYYLTRRGHEGSSFIPVITCGAHINDLHYAGEDTLADGQLVLVDLGAEVRYYGVDICRVYPVNGRFDDRQRYWYEVVRQALAAILDKVRPGFDMREIGPLGDRLLARPLMEKGLIASPAEIRRYLGHGICHFVGLDAHDVGQPCVLEPGMALAVEPGLYFRQWGFGVRLEDSVLVTETGMRNLTGTLKIAPDAVEALVGQ